MPMRRVPGVTAYRIELDACGFAAAEMAALDHASLPWWGVASRAVEIAGSPLESAREMGERDRHSLLAQLAAHLAMLRFAAVGWGSFAAAEWVVVRKRREEGRLVRIARAGGGEESAGSFLARAFELLEVEPTESLRATWVRPDAVYAELDGRASEGKTAASRWRRRSAGGWVLSPGPELLARLLTGEPLRLSGADGSIRRSLAAVATLSSHRLFVLGGEGATPLRPFSAVAALGSLTSLEQGRDADACEAIDRAIGSEPTVFFVDRPDRFDASSIHLVRLLATGRRDVSWIVLGEVPPMLAATGPFEIAPRARPFVVSPRLSTLAQLGRVVAALRDDEREPWLETFVQSDDLRRVLDGSPVPSPPEELAIEEPRRSLLAALSIAGPRISLPVVRRLLRDLGWKLAAEDLVCPGLVEIDAGILTFIDPAAHRSLERSLPPESTRLLCSLVAGAMEGEDPWIASLLRFRGGETDRALDAIGDRASLGQAEREQLLGVLEQLPPEARARPPVARLHADLLLRAGRYRRALAVARHLPDPEGRLVRARAERRLGRYEAALGEIEGANPDDPEAILLHAELDRLTGKLESARLRIDRIADGALEPALRDRFAWESALLSIDRGAPVSPRVLGVLGSSPYLRARLATYLALRTGRYPTARSEAARAQELASDLPERIDATLDLLFTLFLSGDWRHARLHGLEALALIEETEGDRAAGGVLFTLAYLCADSAEWERAEDFLGRLRTFYTHTGDGRRLRETELIAAHLALCRGRTGEARGRAGAIDLSELSPEEREAAVLILDEADALEGREGPLRSTGTGACRELRDRHLLLRARREPGAASGIANPFLQALARWEGALRSGDHSQLPRPADRAESLLLLRSLVAAASAHPRYVPRLADLGAQLGVEIAAPGSIAAGAPADRELAILQCVAALPFPFGAADLSGIAWLFARRNRLGTWNQIGSLPPQEPQTLDAILDAPAEDWIRCGDEGLLHLEGVDGWSEGSRASLGALFLMRSEHYTLKRAVEQEAMSIADQPADGSDGIVGNSQPMRELLGTVARIAGRNVAVCIEGESGTGKELVARAVHRGSPRRSRPFVALNCAALPETLVESELFGHARGAFTGADRDKPGLIESADGGTLFLDEIGELSLAAQAKLLRFLQEGELRRLGDAAGRRADVRVVVATNRRLETEVDEGRFREDLYYRVRGVEIRIPTLRERGTDVLLLARWFLARENREDGSQARFSEEVESALLGYEWPGNVRELEQTVRSMVALSGGARIIGLEHLPPRVRP
ncbi:MAG TPA: sigma 54-interacting transcriptional regulator, partial [Thermoanaerobaculia bacterium]|nr:sigma 54-interacting transcriptional regulator [Thermoanaerobaculia bacterium]